MVPLLDVLSTAQFFFYICYVIGWFFFATLESFTMMSATNGISLENFTTSYYVDLL